MRFFFFFLGTEKHKYIKTLINLIRFLMIVGIAIRNRDQSNIVTKT